MRKRILVIDDDAGLQDLLQAILELKDYDVTTAENGLVALEKLQTIKPDLILLDLMMPRMDGYTFIEELQCRGLRSSTPILTLTADTHAKEKVEQMGLDSYLTKPFDLHHFLGEVTKLIEPMYVH